MAKQPQFLDYTDGVPVSRILPYRNDNAIPSELISKLNKINIKSTTALFNFISVNKTGMKTLAAISDLYEDDQQRLKEQLTRKLESIGMIDDRCGNPSNPCSTIPRNLIHRDSNIRPEQRTDKCIQENSQSSPVVCSPAKPTRSFP